MRESLLILAVIAAILPASPTSAATSYVYDDLGRLTQVTYDNGRQITYSYDAAGNRTQVVTANGTNQPPSAVNDSASTNENTAHTFDPRGNDSDPDGDPLTIVSTGTASHGTIAINGGMTLTYTPTTGYWGSDSFSYSISDGNGHTANATVSLTIVNRAPVAANDSITTTKHIAVTFDPRSNDSDPDSDTLTITTTSTPSHGTVAINGGTSLTYSPAAGYIGSDSFTYTISDGQGHTATATVSATINAGTNHAPVAVNDVMAIIIFHPPGQHPTPQKTIDPRVNDSDSDADPLSVTAVTNGTKGTVTFTATSVTYTYFQAVNTLMTTDSFTYTISDGFGGTATATVNVTIDVEVSS